MISYTFHELEWILHAELFGVQDGSIQRVSTDTRLLSQSQGALFFALKGTHHDGHDHVVDAYEQCGTRAFVVSEIRAEYHDLPKATFLYVENTLHALQLFATYHRQRFELPVLGITGSNGKTIVKEWIVQLLSPAFSLHHSPKSWNSQIGVPLSLLGLRPDHAIGIYEAGISRVGEMEQLERMIRPTLGLFTNLGDAHAEGFDSITEKCQEKLKLFVRAERLIVCADHTLIYQEAQQLAQRTQCDLVTWTLSKGTRADLQIELHPHAQAKGKMAFTAHYQGNAYAGLLPGVDRATMENAIEAMLAACELGLPIEQAIERLNALQPVDMRLERRVCINGHALINDSYSLDMVSLRASLDFLLQQAPASERGLILSDFPGQSDDEHAAQYQEVALWLKELGVRLIAGIGPELCRHRSLFSGGNFFLNTEDFLSDFQRQSLGSCAVLVKGNRQFGFERISRILESRGHRTELEINLNALENNLNQYRARLSSGVKMLVLVKAFAYGGGAKEIAQLLQYHKVDYLGVAFADEGVALRRAGVKLPILVLDPEFYSLSTLIDYHLEPSIFSLKLLEVFIDLLKRQNLTQYPVHLKLDTGMHRVGFESNQLKALGEALSRESAVRVASLFTHLAAADDPALDDFTLQQLESFSQGCECLASVLPYRFLRHALNTAGIERFPAFQFDMVRLGIGIHGVSASNGQASLSLLPVATLRTFIVQIKHLKPGDTVGYGRKGVVERECTIATLPIGYADGYSRRMGNGVGRVCVNGVCVPTIGNICMDTCMVDITGVEAAEGDPVILFGENPTLSEVAQSQDTIPYEVLSCISARVPRVYFSR